MIRPIESSMSLYTVDHKAHQAQSDPAASVAQAAQQEEAMKKAAQQLITVQKPQKSEGDVKIRDKNSEKNKDGQKKKRRSASVPDGEPETEDSCDSVSKGGEHFNFLA